MKRFVENLFLVLPLVVVFSTFSFQSAYSKCVDPSNPSEGDICGGSEYKKCCKPGSNGKNYCCYDTSGKNIDAAIDKGTTTADGTCEICK